MKKMYYITDKWGHYYKIDSNGYLVVAKSSDEAVQFTLREANDRIGNKRKAKFYTIIEAEEPAGIIEESVYEAP